MAGGAAADVHGKWGFLLLDRTGTEIHAYQNEFVV